MLHRETKMAWGGRIAAAALVLLAVSTDNAAAQQSPLIGFWECAGQANGVTYASTFDYRADGTYISTQRISAGASLIEGGGGGRWRLDGSTLSDTKERGTLDRFVRDGVEVPSTDPEWQSLYRQAQSNVGQTVSGEIVINGDVALSGMYTCTRRRR